MIYNLDLLDEVKTRRDVQTDSQIYRRQCGLSLC